MDELRRETHFKDNKVACIFSKVRHCGRTIDDFIGDEKQ